MEGLLSTGPTPSSFIILCFRQVLHSVAESSDSTNTCVSGRPPQYLKILVLFYHPEKCESDLTGSLKGWDYVKEVKYFPPLCTDQN